MRTSRREFLGLAASTLLTGACAGYRSSNDSVQTFTPQAAGTDGQVLDPHLRFMLPPDAVDPRQVHAFAADQKVSTSTIDVRSDDELLLRLAAGAQGEVDVIVVAQDALTTLIVEQEVEPLARPLIPNLSGLEAPFDDPNYDSGNRHAIPKDYTTIGIALDDAVALNPPDSWAGFFRLARLAPGQVLVPDDPQVVIGAALVALGHDWNSSSSGDLDDVRALLTRLRFALRVEGTLARPAIPHPLAALVSSRGYRTPRRGVRFVVPVDGSVARTRSYCIPVYAPDPVTAHAWLNYALEPAVAAADALYTQRATPVAQAIFSLPNLMVGNPAIFPSADARATLGFENLTPDALAARLQLWHEVMG